MSYRIIGARRLFEIAAYLARCDGRRLTGETMAEAFEISLRTLYRDIETLRTMGLPISGEAGVGYAVPCAKVTDWLFGMMVHNRRAIPVQDIDRRFADISMPTRADIDRIRGRAGRRKRAMEKVSHATGEYLAGRIPADVAMAIIIAAIKATEQERPK